MYKIKPLEWVYDDTSEIYIDVEKQWLSSTEFMNFKISKYRNDDELLVQSDYWYKSFTDLGEAKKCCEDEWQKRLKRCLIEV